MDIESFKKQYAALRDVDKVQVDSLCDHTDHINAGAEIAKGPAKRNILKHGGKEFVCRACDMKHNNPMVNKRESRQTDEEVTVYCPHEGHEGDPARQMKKACYYGEMKEPYLQVCKSCAQLGHGVSEERRLAISIALKGVPKGEEFKKKLASYWAAHPERREQATAILLANKCCDGMLGKHHSDEARAKMSVTMTGREYTDEHCQHISEGRTKMLAETGGFTQEHRENISRATIEQYKKGFKPHLHHLSGWHDSPKAGRVFYRSSYEKKAYLKLDDAECVTSYKTEAVSIRYWHPTKKIQSSYLIDLDITYEDGSRLLVEVKPEKWLSNEIVVAKIAAARKRADQTGVIFEVWTEMDLFGHVYNEKHMRSFVEKVRHTRL